MTSNRDVFNSMFQQAPEGGNSSQDERDYVAREGMFSYESLPSPAFQLPALRNESNQDKSNQDESSQSDSGSLGEPEVVLTADDVAQAVQAVQSPTDLNSNHAAFDRLKIGSLSLSDVDHFFATDVNHYKVESREGEGEGEGENSDKASDSDHYSNDNATDIGIGFVSKLRIAILRGIDHIVWEVLNCARDADMIIYRVRAANDLAYIRLKFVFFAPKGSLAYDVYKRHNEDAPAYSLEGVYNFFRDVALQDGVQLSREAYPLYMDDDSDDSSAYAASDGAMLKFIFLIET